jgi:hypothetical protein
MLAGQSQGYSEVPITKEKRGAPHSGPAYRASWAESGNREVPITKEEGSAAQRTSLSC